MTASPPTIYPKMKDPTSMTPSLNFNALFGGQLQASSSTSVALSDWGTGQSLPSPTSPNLPDPDDGHYDHGASLSHVANTNARRINKRARKRVKCSLCDETFSRRHDMMRHEVTLRYIPKDIWLIQ